MPRRLRFACPSCATTLAPLDGLDHATQVVRRTCRACGERYQLVVHRLPTSRDDLALDHATFTFLGHSPRPHDD